MIRLLLVELEPDDQPTRALARALRDEGAEVIYTSARTAGEIAVAATQEDVKAVGFAVSTAEHRRIAAEVAGQAVVFATVDDDGTALRQVGITAVFGAGSADHIVAWAGKLA